MKRILRCKNCKQKYLFEPYVGASMTCCCPKCEREWTNKLRVESGYPPIFY